MTASTPQQAAHDADRRLLGAATWALAIRGLGPAVAFVMSVLIARLLGAAGAGQFYIAVTVVMGAGIAARCGLDTALLRFAGVAGGRGAIAPGLLGRVLAITAAFGLVVTLALLHSADWLALRLFDDPALGRVLSICALAVVPMALIHVQASLLKAASRVGWAAFVEGLGMPSMVTALLLLAAMAGPVAPTTVALCYLTGVIGASLLGLAITLGCLARAGAADAPPTLRQIMATAVPLFWVDALNFVLAWSPLLLLGALASSSDAGVYNVAQRLTTQVGLLVALFGSITAPRFAAMHHAGDLPAVHRLMVLTTRRMSLLAAPPLLLFVVWPTPILALFGAEFGAAADPLRVLALGQLVNAMTGPAGYLLAVTGQERTLRNCQLATVTLVIALTLGLIPVFGALGAAMAASTGLAFNNLACLWLVNRRLGLDLHPRHLIASVN